MTYRAPINDMLLALNHGAGLEAAVKAGHYGDFDADITAAVLEEAGKFASDHGVKVAIEPHPGFVVYNVETALRLREAAGKNVGVNFDPSHFFWQGVDVQGEQLSCVIIDRLPFAVPNDPVVAARINAIDSEGGNAFFEYQVPSAVISLKQGFGRLIRSLKDRGLLGLLDNRVLKQRYGRVFIDSLPPYRKTTDLADVEQFFGLR